MYLSEMESKNCTVINFFFGPRKYACEGEVKHCLGVLVYKMCRGWKADKRTETTNGRKEKCPCN